MTPKSRPTRISQDGYRRSLYKYAKGIDGFDWVHDHVFDPEAAMKSKTRDHKKYKPLF